MGNGVGHLLFSLSGRIDRLQFWTGFAVMVLSLIGLFVAGILAIGSLTAVDVYARLASFGVLMLAFVAIVILNCWMSWAIAIKRMHDRDKSGKTLLVSLLPAAILLWVAMTEGFFAAVLIEKAIWFRLIQVGIGVWLLVELGFRAGTPGGNRYGPPPGDTGSAGDDITERMLAEVRGETPRAATGPSVATARPPAAVAVAKHPRTGPVQPGPHAFGRRRGAPA